MNLSLLNHCHLYAFPLATHPGPTLQLAATTIATVACHDQQIASTTFSVSFEQAFQRLQQLERLFIELDGYFVWTGQHDSQPWQIDGMLYDYGEHLQRVELKGGCPGAAWRQLLDCFDWPKQRLLAHCIDRNCFVDVAELIHSGESRLS